MANSSQYTHVSVQTLPIEDIGILLKFKHGFADLDAVGVASFEELAVKATGMDRGTVEKALNLYNKDTKKVINANEVMLKSDGLEITTQGKEILDLRDELYQLKAEMARKGYTTNYDDYAGFHESFSNTDIIYEDTIIGAIAEPSNSLYRIIMNDEGFRQLRVRDLIVVEYTSSSTKPVVREISSLLDGNIVVLKESLPESALPGSAVVRKSLGRYMRGSFAFAEKPGEIYGPAVTSGIDDDTATPTVRLINNNLFGLGYSFKINNRNFGTDNPDKGYLHAFSIIAEKIGNPGPLKAYVIREAERSQFVGINESNFKDLVVAVSRDATIPHSAVPGTREKMTFDFRDNLGMLPLIKNERLLIVIVASGDVSEDNYYTVEFLKGTGSGDLQTQNKVYEYRERWAGTSDVLDDTSTGLNLSDLHYEVSIRPIQKEVVRPYSTGLYTKKFKIRNDSSADKARLTLRINREGMFATAEGGSLGSSIRFVTDNSDNASRYYDITQLNGIGARTNDFVIVGQNASKYVTQSPTSVDITQKIFADKGDPVYRMGYKVFLRPIEVKYGTNVTGEPTRTVIPGEPVEMPLLRVIEDRAHRKSTVSDRLVFECQLPGTPTKKYTEFELQIKWDTAFTDKEFYIDEVYSEELHGAIQDLALSLERQ